jgi:DNA-binding transcriptional regulator GbsR (MarR family)
MSSPDRVTLRDLSQAVFGQRYRLELMLVVAASSDGIVCLTDLARELDISISNLQNPLRAMITAGLLTPLPRGDSRRKFYIRNPSAAWTWATELRDHAATRNIGAVDT